MQRSLSLATDRAERILTLMKSQNVAIYDKKSLVASQLPLTREPSVVVWGKVVDVLLRWLWGWRVDGRAIELY